MASDMQTTLIGTLTRDPELRYTTGGRAVASGGIACNRRYQSNGEWQEETSFFNFTVWGEQGEHVAESLSKGTRVILTGRLNQREYETREGEKRSVVEVVVDGIGPELRWATAQVVKVERDRASAPAKPPAPEPTEYGDEEPF